MSNRPEEPRRGSALKRATCGTWLALSLLAASAPADDLVDAFATDESGTAAAAALSLARSTFDGYVLRRERVSVPQDLPGLLQKRSAVFVSAERDGAPRCCMGSLYPTEPALADEIIAAAIAAAGRDARRKPVRPDELPHLRLIVSVVAPPEPMASPWSIDPVREGIACRSSTQTGVVLPGETPHIDRAVNWARVRASARTYEPVDWFRIRAFRIAEPKKPREEPQGRE